MITRVHVLAWLVYLSICGVYLLVAGVPQSTHLTAGQIGIGAIGGLLVRSTARR